MRAASARTHATSTLVELSTSPLATARNSVSPWLPAGEDCGFLNSRPAAWVSTLGVFRRGALCLKRRTFTNHRPALASIGDCEFGNAPAIQRERPCRKMPPHLPAKNCSSPMRWLPAKTGGRKYHCLDCEGSRPTKVARNVGATLGRIKAPRSKAQRWRSNLPSFNSSNVSKTDQQFRTQGTHTSQHRTVRFS